MNENVTEKKSETTNIYNRYVQMDEKVVLTTEEYRRLVRCETALATIFALAQVLTSYNLHEDINAMIPMHPELSMPMSHICHTEETGKTGDDE